MYDLNMLMPDCCDLCIIISECKWPPLMLWDGDKQNQTNTNKQIHYAYGWHWFLPGRVTQRGAETQKRETWETPDFYLFIVQYITLFLYITANLKEVLPMSLVQESSSLWFSGIRHNLYQDLILNTEGQCKTCNRQLNVFLYIYIQYTHHYCAVRQPGSAGT